MNTRIFHLQALSALHIGTGQGVGTVDLPIARSRATNLPLIPGSALKGVLRDEAKKQWGLKDDINVLFGAESRQENPHAGAIAFGDAHLLLLPVRSFAGTVAYATCPFVLRRYARDTAAKHAVPDTEAEALLCKNSKLKVSGEKIALEDLDLQAKECDEMNAWADTLAAQLYPDTCEDAEAWREQLKQRLVLLPDNVFSFLADTATEIRMRIRIDRQTRIVQNGALWSEENLPAESVLWGVMGIGNARDKSKQSAADLSAKIPAGETAIQIGGKHTVGRGLCRLLIAADTQAGEQA